MSNYSIQSEKDKKFYVKEESTEQIINAFDNRRDANKFIKKVKSGFAFSGWTPSFFLKKVNIRIREKVNEI